MGRFSLLTARTGPSTARAQGELRANRAAAGRGGGPVVLAVVRRLGRGRDGGRRPDGPGTADHPGDPDSGQPHRDPIGVDGYPDPAGADPAQRVAALLGPNATALAASSTAGAMTRITVAGIAASAGTPSPAANSAHAHRPAATPSGSPASRASAANVLACQAVIVCRGWPWCPLPARVPAGRTRMPGWWLAAPGGPTTTTDGCACPLARRRLDVAQLGRWTTGTLSRARSGFSSRMTT
jgi:hypothetical protein